MKCGEVKYLRILLTTRCNMSCCFCHREGASSAGEDIVRPVLFDVVGRMHELGFEKFKLMGGEPMLYPQLDSVIVGMRRRIGSSDLSMISNGTASPEAYEKLLSLGLNRLNISIHGWMLDSFVANTGCSIEVCDKIRNTVCRLSERRLIGKLNYVVKRGVNEKDFCELINFAGERELVVDALNLLVFGDNASAAAYRYSMSELECFVRSRFDVKASFEVQNKYSLPSKLLKLTNGASINLKVSKMNESMAFQACISCSKRNACVEGIKAMRVTPPGILQPCLMRTDNTLDLRGLRCNGDIVTYLGAL